ncbi:MAG TPA: helix-turn-helix domain-containing protein [Gemmatimonadaceae bacterium]|nr:helix-turn-helix domain-containing protein [Gemmatimonadaceae bacterium]
MVKKKTSAQAHDGETEQRILEAAKAVFIRHGTAGARMQDIAEEAGVNQALLHYYFRSKEKLSDAVFRDTAGRMFPALIQIVGSDEPVTDKIDRIVETYLTTMSRTPFLPGYIISELHHHPERIPQLLGKMAGGDLTAITRPAFDKLEKQLAAEARAGRMRRMNVAQFFVNLLSLCVFPFAARPMLDAALGFDNDDFAKFIEQRRKELPVYIRSAIKP